MIRIFLLIVLLPGLPACRGSRPFQSIVRGSMDMDGRMDMDGQMSMDGDMQMSGQMATVLRGDNSASRLASVPVYASAAVAPQAGRIVVIDVDGLLVNKHIGGMGALGENPVALFREKLDHVAADPSVAALVLRINSPGGGVTAADIMARDLYQVKTSRNLPVVACLMDVGAGAGYYLACTADAVVAHPTSLVGGIGVIMNAYNMQVAIEQYSIASIPIKAGESIDIASPEREMELEERAQLQAIADEFHQRFITRVQQARPTVTQTQIFDGRVVSGATAQQWGLVDQLGYLDDAVVQARQLAQLPPTAPLVMFRRDNDRAYTLLDVTPVAANAPPLLPLKLPGLDRSTLPTFMYLWQPEPSFVTANGG